jgi:hypothetical protein
MEKQKVIVFLIKTVASLSKLEKYMNEGYVISNSGIVSNKTYWILKLENIEINGAMQTQIDPNLWDRPEIDDTRIVEIKGNDNYIADIEQLKKEGFIIKQVFVNNAIMMKYVKKEGETK